MDTKHFLRRALSRLARETLFRKMDDSAAYAILDRTTRVLDQLGVQWWLTDGTLLGFVREGGFLPHDTDVDLALLARDYTPKLERALVAAGLELYASRGQLNDGLELTVRSRWLYLPGTSLDMFLYYEDEATDSFWCACYHKGHQLRYRYKRFDTLPLELRGKTYRVPDPPERFLEQKYGPSWQRFDPAWNNMLSPRSLELDHLAPSVQKKIRAEKASSES